MKSAMKFDIAKFETIGDGAVERLVGGFSLSYSSQLDTALSAGDTTTNNCQGGNCTSSCGSGQNIQCNAVAHCGT